MEGWKAGDTEYLVVLLPPNKDTEGAKRYWRCKVEKNYYLVNDRNIGPEFFLIIALKREKFRN